MQKKTFALVLTGLVLLVAGCESFTQPIKERFVGVPPKTHVIAVERRAAYAITLQALKVLNFRYVRGGPAQGELEAISNIYKDNYGSGARQTSVVIHFAAADDNNATTTVSALFTDIEEDSYQPHGLSTAKPLSESGYYTALFDEIDRQLQAPKP